MWRVGVFGSALLLPIAAVAPAAALEIASADEHSLRQWEAAIAASVEEMAEAERHGGTCGGDVGAWLLAHCGAEAEEQCAVTIRQDVQRFGEYEHLLVAGDPKEAAENLGNALRAEQLELVQKGRQLRQMLAFLEGKPGASHFSDAEVEAQVARARSVDGSRTARVEVAIGVPVGPGRSTLKEGASCTRFTLAKPASMYLATEPCIANQQDDNGDVVAETAELSALLEPQLLYLDAFTAANDRWASMHPILTYIWLYFLNVWAYMVPCFGSGPFMPEASCNWCSFGFLPWSNMFGPHVSCASPLGIITETVNPGASFWLESCEFGLLTPCQKFGRHSGWLLPGVGQNGQLLPGRPLPDRDFCGSHPCGCFNVEGRPDIYSAVETYVAPERQGYDSKLVQLLYSLSAQNASFSEATFFTTSLTQLAILGYYPRNTALQHHGVQFTVAPGSPRIPGQRRGSGLDSEGARVLTVEMVAEGLMWSLREKELGPGEMHSAESYAVGRLPAEVLADYILDQKGTTYADADCQLYARNMLDRVLAHSGKVQPTGRILGDGPEVMLRFVVLVGIAAVLVATSALAQWAVVCRLIWHLCQAPAEARSLPRARVRHVWGALGRDADMLEERVAALLGKRASSLTRQACVFVAMLQCPPLLWYKVFKLVRKQRFGEALAAQKAPLVANVESL